MLILITICHVTFTCLPIVFGLCFISNQLLDVGRPKHVWDANQSRRYFWRTSDPPPVVVVTREQTYQLYSEQVKKVAPVKRQQWRRMMLGLGLSFLLILQSLFPAATTKATPQLTWSSTKPAPQEGQGSQLQRDMFSKIFHQLEKTVSALVEGTRLSRRYLINWSQSGRHLSPFIPLVSLELEPIVNGKVGKGGKSPALRFWKRGPGEGQQLSFEWSMGWAKFMAG